MRIAILGVSALLAMTSPLAATPQQQTHKSASTQASAMEQQREDLRRKINSGLVGIVLGLSDSEGPSMLKVSDFFQALEKENELRIFQIGGRSATQNTIELSFARGIDAGIIQSDILDSLRQKPPFPGIDSYLRYVAKLYDKEVHILAKTEIQSIQELKGKKVNFGKRDSDNFLTANKVFGTLGIEVTATEFPPEMALDKLRNTGDIDALVYVASKPADLFNFGSDPNLHFVSIPPMSGGYTPTTLRPQDYYQLLQQPLQTVAVGSILMVYNWPQKSERYQKVARFVRRLLEEHAKKDTKSPINWPEIDIAASLPGWSRFAPADKWIKAQDINSATPRNYAAAGATKEPEKVQLFAEFREYLKKDQRALTQPEKLQLFTEFVEYQKRHSTERQLFAQSLSHRD